MNMPIENVMQPEIIQISDNLRLKKYEETVEMSYWWYRDPIVLKGISGEIAEPYSKERVQRMYQYLIEHGELYYIEIWKEERYFPIGDVTFWREDMPIVIGDASYRGVGIGELVIQALINRAKTLGYKEIFVEDIYFSNISSQHVFKKCGFCKYKKKENSWSYRLIF